MARPLGFDPDDALAIVKDLFWRRGYEAVSLADIEQATGLNKQSLYRLYGDKRGLYLAAFDHYLAHEVAATAAFLMGDAPPADKLSGFLRLATDAAAAGDRRGCFLCNASLDQAALDPETGEKVASAMRDVQTLLAHVLRSMACDAPEPRAAALMAAYFGLRVMARAGLDDDTLRAAAASALAGLSCAPQ